MLSVVIEAFKKSGTVYVPLYTFSKSLFGMQQPWTATGLYITLHSSSAKLDRIFPVQIHLIGIWDSPDHRSVRNKEVKFIWIYSLGLRFRVRCPYCRESVL